MEPIELEEGFVASVAGMPASKITALRSMVDGRCAALGIDRKTEPAMAIAVDVPADVNMRTVYDWVKTTSPPDESDSEELADKKRAQVKLLAKLKATLDDRFNPEFVNKPAKPATPPADSEASSEPASEPATPAEPTTPPADEPEPAPG